MTIGIIGASGQLGRRIANQLASRGLRGRLLLRAPDRWPDQHHLAVGADLDAPATLAPALANIETLILITADGPRQVAQGKAAIKAARAAGVKRIVLVSAILAGEAIPQRFGARHAAIETYLRASGLPHVLLRPCFFMQSFFLFAAQIRKGRLICPVPTGRVAFVDLEDVAEAASICALAPEWEECAATKVLTGPGGLSFGDAALLLSRTMGRPVRHIAPPLVVARALIFVTAGPAMSADMAYLFRCLELGREAHPTDDLAEILGRAPTTLETCFSREATNFRG